MSRTATRHPVPFTPAEDERLRTLRAAGRTFEEMATLMGRTRDSIAGRLRKLKLPPPERARGAQAHGRNGTSGAWPPERDAELRRLVAVRPALGASQIGNRLGLGKGAVIGRCWRLGISLGGRPGAHTSDTSLAGRMQRRRKGPANGGWNGKPRQLAVSPAPLPATPVGRPTKSILQLERRHCRFIGERPALMLLDTPIYCGAPALEGSAYCAEHHALCWQRPRPLTGRRFMLPRR
jgi:hypothetical protein